MSVVIAETGRIDDSTYRYTRVKAKTKCFNTCHLKISQDKYL